MVATAKPPPQDECVRLALLRLALLERHQRAYSGRRDGWVAGDTDTVAAITGGLLGARLTATDVLAELPWHAAVRLPGAVLVTETSSALAAVRASARP